MTGRFFDSAGRRWLGGTLLLAAGIAIAAVAMSLLEGASADVAAVVLVVLLVVLVITRMVPTP